VNAQDEFGRTALHCSVTLKHVACVKVLLQDGRTDRERQAKDRGTPLHEAAIKGFDDIVEILLAKRDSRVGKRGREANQIDTGLQSMARTPFIPGN
jgi:ankyrin repeat protein